MCGRKSGAKAKAEEAEKTAAQKRKCFLCDRRANEKADSNENSDAEKSGRQSWKDAFVEACRRRRTQSEF